jgi:hypothetical protein
MPICPKCKSEYLSGYDTCADCHVKLVEKLDDVQKNENVIDQSLVFLKNVSDDYHKDLIISFLETENINVIEKHEGIGQYLKIYSGQSYQGKNLYVLEEDYERAKILVESLKFKKETTVESNEDYILEYNRKLKRRKRILQGFIFITFIAPLLFVIVFNLFG